MGTTFLLCFSCVAQRSDDLGIRKEMYDDLFLLPHWEVLVSSNVTAKGHLEHFQPAKYQLFTKPQISYEFGVRRIRQLDTHMGFVLGFQFGLVGWNAAYIVPGNEVGLSSNEEYPFAGPIARDGGISYLSIPAELEYRFFTSHSHMFLLNGGLSLRFAPLNNTSFADMDAMEVKLTGNKTPFVNVNIGGGVGFLLKNLDMIKVGVKLNYDPFYIAKGPFRLDTYSSSDVGIYKIKGTSAGLTLLYTRTKSLRHYAN